MPVCAQGVWAEGERAWALFDDADSRVTSLVIRQECVVFLSVILRVWAEGEGA